VNVLSPHPWIFWITIGGPLLVTQVATSLWHPLAFLVGFYALLVGSKVLLAAAIAGGRRWLNDRTYRFVLAASGLLLIFFGLLLLREAISLAI
jgi:threonine/homoserine/homoserine lactone efflux protein